MTQGCACQHPSDARREIPLKMKLVKTVSTRKTKVKSISFKPMCSRGLGLLLRRENAAQGFPGAVGPHGLGVKMKAF